MLLLWIKVDSFIPINLPNLNPICYLLALGDHHFLHVGRIRVKLVVKQCRLAKRNIPWCSTDCIKYSST